MTLSKCIGPELPRWPNRQNPRLSRSLKNDLKNWRSHMNAWPKNTRSGPDCMKTNPQGVGTDEDLVENQKLEVARCHSPFHAWSGLLSFGHATEGGGAGAGSDGAIGAGADSNGAIGAGAGFRARFLAFALLAGFAFFVAFFIPFFLRAGAPRFAFLDFFATFNLPNRTTKIMQHGITP